MKHLKGVLLVFFLVVCFTCLNGAESEVLYGVNQVKFPTSYGNIYVTLPDDMAIGDIISGRLFAASSGPTDKKRSQNEKRLKKYSVEIGGEKTAIGDNWGKWKIPPGENTSIKLLDPKGNIVDSIRVPMQSQPPPGKDKGFQCPSIAEAERPFHIFGLFNGDFSDTTVMMGDIELEKFAESPRCLIVESPGDVIGNTRLNYSEGNVKGTCELRNISVHTSVGKDKLLEGENTNLSVTIRGLEGLEEGLPLYIKNKTPKVVSVKGEGVIDIQPKDVKTDGIFVYTTTVTGIIPGHFRIFAGVLEETASPAKKSD